MPQRFNDKKHLYNVIIIEHKNIQNKSLENINSHANFNMRRDDGAEARVGAIASYGRARN